MKKYNILLLSSFFIALSINYTSFSKEKIISINNDNLYPEKTMKRDALDAYESKNYAKAKLLYEKLIKKSPDNYYYHFNLANSLFMNKDYKNAFDKYIYVIKKSDNEEYVIESTKKLKEIIKVLKNNLKNKKENVIVKNTMYVNDEADKYYICNESDPTIFTDEEDNTFRRWEKEDLPLKIYISKIPDSYNVENPEKYYEWFKKSIDRWRDKIPNSISYSYVDNESKANIIVNWKNYFNSSVWGEAQLPLIDPNKNKRLSIINLAVRAKLSNGEFPFSEPEFVQIVTHEFGHTLGLAHSYPSAGNDDIMYPQYRTRIPGNEPDITQRDINTIKILYSLDKNINYKCK
ncbi:MAG: matrixin family metalloprotease [Candidatus Sericytochromatia bacterium]